MSPASRGFRHLRRPAARNHPLDPGRRRRRKEPVWLRAVPDVERIAALRLELLRLPFWVILLACAGWLPGGVLFPLGIDLLAGPLGTSAAVYLGFLMSFTLSGLIALSYSLLGVKYLVLRVLYPRFWVDARELRRHARIELHSEERRLHWLQLLCGLIPLTAAVLMVGAHRVDAGTLTTGALVAYLLYIDLFFAPVQQLSQVFDGYQQAMVGLQRIRDLLRTPTSTPQAAEPIAVPGRLRGDITFDDLDEPPPPCSAASAAGDHPSLLPVSQTLPQPPGG